MVCLNLHEIFQRLNRYFSTFNLFPTVPPTTDQFELQTQKISTYFYIVTLILSFTTFTAYTLTITITKTFTEKEPSLVKYFKLNVKYEESLTCPCMKISVDYGKFLHIDYALNQVCSSSFVTQTWIDLIKKSGKSSYIHSNDFRKVSPHIFRALMALCEQVDDTISRSVLQFYTDQYVSIDLTPLALVQSRAELIFNQYKSSTISRYLSSLGIMREMTATNAIFSYLGTNAQFYHSRTNFTVKGVIMKYDNCSCSRNSSCILPISFYSDLDWDLVFTVPGLYTGCYVFEALLQSNLQCFYNQTCLDELISFVDFTETFDGLVMNESLPSPFNSTTPVSEMLENLMTDNWTWSMEYEKYFNECRPFECTYLVGGRNSVIYAVTQLISLTGGLVTVLQWIVPRFIHLFRRKKAHTGTDNGKTYFDYFNHK